MSEEQKQRESDETRLAQALAMLGEHFDTVQIFVTRHEAGSLNGTIGACKGEGNWYARLGYVKEWILQHDGNAFNSSRE